MIRKERRAGIPPATKDDILQFYWLDSCWRWYWTIGWVWSIVRKKHTYFCLVEGFVECDLTPKDKQASYLYEVWCPCPTLVTRTELWFHAVGWSVTNAWITVNPFGITMHSRPGSNTFNLQFDANSSNSIKIGLLYIWLWIGSVLAILTVPHVENLMSKRMMA